MKPVLLFLLAAGLVSCIPRERPGRVFARDSPESLPSEEDGDGSSSLALHSSFPVDDKESRRLVYRIEDSFKRRDGQDRSKRGFFSKLKEKMKKQASKKGNQSKKSPYGDGDTDNRRDGQTRRKMGFIDKLKNKFGRKKGKQSKNPPPPKNENNGVDERDDPEYSDDYDGGEEGEENFSENDDFDDDDQRPLLSRPRYARGELLERALRNLVVLSSHLTLNGTQNKITPSADTMIREVDEDQQVKEKDDEGFIGQEGENEALGEENSPQVE